jgi:hypothetical protein
MDYIEAPQGAEGISQTLTGTESARFGICLDDMAESEIIWEEVAIGERLGLGTLLLNLMNSGGVWFPRIYFKPRHIGLLIKNIKYKLMIKQIP